jgi:transposase
MFKDIQEEDERSESEQDEPLEAKPIDQEMTESEVQMMHSGILDALKSFHRQFQRRGQESEPEPTHKPKRKADAKQQVLERLTVKQTEPGETFITKKSGNGGACVTMHRRKSNDKHKAALVNEP